MLKLLSLFIPLSLSPCFYVQEQELSADEVTSESIKSVWFEKEGWQLAYPVVNSLSGDNLTIHFDILDDRGETLWYRIVHCSRDWEISDLFTSDYTDSFEENPLNDFQSSFNTLVPYSHYSLTLPNEDVNFKVSGNYIVAIWAPGDKDHPLLVRRFFVSEGATSTSVVFRRAMKPGTTETHQQSEIIVSTGSLPVRDPYRQITLTIMQNGRWDSMKQDLAPDFVGNNRVEFNTLSEKTLFPGGNEFRFFDIKTIRQKRQNVRAIEYLENRYHVYLLPSEDREFRQYFYNDDLNGKFITALEGSDDPDRDADYVWVYFSLPVNAEMRGGSVYVTGSFNNWKYNSQNRMRYNLRTGAYEAVLLLKQGWYNYEYAFVPDGSERPAGYSFEGSHYETENDYLILTYFRDPRDRYDRLTDITIANTRTAK